MAEAIYWIGQDGNIYYGSGQEGAPVQNLGNQKSGGMIEGEGGIYDPWTDNGVPSLIFAAQKIADPSAPTTNNSNTGAADTSAQTIADNNLYLDDQDTQLKSLLGRTDTSLAQGLKQNQDQYDTEVGGAETDKENAYKGYAGNRQDQLSGREKSRSTNNINAGTGYRSLAQIIGRASGSGSSAYRELLPSVIGNDLAGKQRSVNETYGQNLQNIDKRQNEYDSEYTKILKDLLTQRNNNESTLRTNIEGQRQNIYGQQAQVAGQRATNNGGGYAQVAAAQALSNANIENSRNTVEGFFNQFRTPYTRQAAVAGTPDLSTYTTDRTNITAQNTGNQNNPYATFLRKKLQQ